MMQILVVVAAFLAVSMLVGAVAVLFRDRSDNKLEDRLDVFAGLKKKVKDDQEAGNVLSEPLESTVSFAEHFVNRITNVKLLLEQADSQVAPSQFVLTMGIIGGVGTVLPMLVGLSPFFAPAIGALCALLPIGYMLFKRKRRLKKFAAQLPEALELLARALRAGHSLGAGFNLVKDEMTDPIGSEFGRVYEEQNLNIPLEDALNSICGRIPNLDLKFFATAVILQRQTGGDLAEILDKIGNLIRERFKIFGQVQALTGEGRLSGIVLLALPPFLAAAVYYLNPGYLMPLFTDPMGHKMLAVAIVLQVLGALVIRKIVNIKV